MKTLDEILKKIDGLDNLEKYQEIIELIEKLPVEQLNNQIISEQGRAYNNIGEYNKAIEIFKTIETEEKDTRRWNYRIAYAYYYLGDYKNSEKYFLRADEIGPEDDEIKNYLLNVYIDLSKETLEEDQEKAIEYALKAKDYIKTDDNKVQVYSYLAWMYDRIEAYDIAEDLLNSIINCKTDQRNEIWIYSELGYCLGEQHRYEESLEALLKSYEMGRNDIWLNSQIGWTFRILGRCEEALEYLFRAKELGRDDSWLNAEIGQCLGRLEKHDEGIERLKKALEILEKDKSHNNTGEKIFINSEIGWLIGRKEKSNAEEALYYLNAAKELGRDDIWINSEIGWELAYNDNKDEEAIKNFEKAIELGRDDEWIWSRIANVYFDLKRFEDAFNAYSKAYKLAKNSWYVCNIGRCLRRLGKYEEAVKKLIQSRKLSLKEGDVVDLEDLELAYCYAALGDKKKAEKHMKLSIDSLGSRAENEEHLKEQFDEIKEMISVLSKPS